MKIKKREVEFSLNDKRNTKWGQWYYGSYRLTKSKRTYSMRIGLSLL
jgi:hypothetical protein